MDHNEPNTAAANSPRVSATGTQGYGLSTPTIGMD